MGDNERKKKEENITFKFYALRVQKNARCMRFSDNEFLFCTADIVIPNAEIILR